MSTKYYFHAVAADRQLFATIAAGRKFWLLVATGKLISIIYLLYLLKEGKKHWETTTVIFTQKSILLLMISEK